MILVRGGSLVQGVTSDALFKDVIFSDISECLQSQLTETVPPQIAFYEDRMRKLQHELRKMQELNKATEDEVSPSPPVSDACLALPTSEAHPVFAVLEACSDTEPHPRHVQHRLYLTHIWHCLHLRNIQYWPYLRLVQTQNHILHRLYLQHVSEATLSRIVELICYDMISSACDI